MGTAFQMVAAMQGRDPRVVAAVAKNVVLADWVFTTPAGFIQPISGITMVYLSGWSLWEGWLVLTYILYTIALFAWLPVVWLQGQIRDMAVEADDASVPLSQKCIRYYHIWFALGWPAFLALMGVFWLMVTKPVF